MASTAWRRAGDESCNLNAIFMVHELSFDTSPIDLGTDTKQIIRCNLQGPAQISNPGRRNGVSTILVFLNLLECLTRRRHQMELGEALCRARKTKAPSIPTGFRAETGCIPVTPATTPIQFNQCVSLV
jgi:hypothetical protein